MEGAREFGGGGLRVGEGGERCRGGGREKGAGMERERNGKRAVKGARWGRRGRGRRGRRKVQGGRPGHKLDTTQMRMARVQQRIWRTTMGTHTSAGVAPRKKSHKQGSSNRRPSRTHKQHMHTHAPCTPPTTPPGVAQHHVFRTERTGPGGTTARWLDPPQARRCPPQPGPPWPGCLAGTGSSWWRTGT